MKKGGFLRLCAFTALVLASWFPYGCSKDEVAYDTNLLSNPSFEEAKGGIPKGWHLDSFHGLKGEKEVAYGVTDEEAFEGKKSFFFRGESDTKRWYVLSQEVKVSGVSHVRLRGAMKLKGVHRMKGQYSYCNFFLTFFDENHNRFQEMRFADKRTLLRRGTRSWFIEDDVFRVPKRTKYIVVGCVLGMNGTVWFDDLSLMVPKPPDWIKQSTQNFDFYALPEREFPKGAMERQQQIFDWYCNKLGIKSDVRISYYLYPDTATIREMMSLKGVQYISWDDREIHTLDPIDEHEVVHFITDPYGKPPRFIAEGSAFYLIAELEGEPVHESAARLLARNRLPTLTACLNYGDMVKIPVRFVFPAAKSFVGYLFEIWGPERMLELFNKANGTNSYPTFAEAFKQVYKIPLDEVEGRWRRFLAKRIVVKPDTTEN